VLDANRMWLAIAAGAALVLAVSWLRQPSADPSAEPVALVTVKDGDKVRTEQITRAQCLAQGGRVWAAMDGGAECIAYIAPQGGIGGGTAVLFFEGDFGNDDLSPERADKVIASYRQLVTEGQRRFELPFVVVARPGLMGSSGFHLLGGRRDEGEILNVAVDALKQRYGFSRLVLAGQSGGSRVVAQLLVLGRRDVACAVMGSGAYGVPDTRRGKVPTNVFGEPGRKYLVPLRQAEAVPSSDDRRIFVIGDPRDKRTPFEGQRQWAEKLRAHGHHAVLAEAAGQGSEYHGLTLVSLQAAGMCATGKSDAEIAAFLAAQSKAGRDKAP
jgi:pimeloyl-ACP methyl ester carboxylesterase